MTSTALPFTTAGFSIWDSSFAISGSVGPGTYYLTLSEGVATNGANPVAVYWDQINGASTASRKNLDVAGVSSIGSESFTINGTTASAVPEGGSTVLLAALALGGLALARRRQGA